MAYNDDRNIMETIQDIKGKMESIGQTYDKDVLLGYIAFFASNWTDEKSTVLAVRLNGLRLKVYRRIAREKGFYNVN